MSMHELTLRQIRNTRESDVAPFGLRMDVFRFDGSFLSLVIDLPEEVEFSKNLQSLNGQMTMEFCASNPRQLRRQQ